MNRSTLGAVVAVVLLAIGAAWWSAGRLAATDIARLGAPSRAAGATAAVAAEAARREQDIALYERRITEDPIGAADRAALAGLYLQRSRETGDPADVARAESLARRSLALRASRNARTNVTLAASLMAQHRFAEARAVARHLVELEPDVASYRALLGETELELGDYKAARATFASLDPLLTPLSVAPRLARWAELTGRIDVARRILGNALADARGRADLPREQQAWFGYRLGDLELRSGRPAAAERAFADGLAINPDDYRILGALARLEAVRRRPRRAVDYGERAIAVVLDPATLGVIADAYEALGDSQKAEEYARAMEVAVAGQPGPYHRAWSLFLLDHGRRVPDVLASAEAEIAIRRDVYGYDLLAWALHKAGRDRDARRAMTQALRLGTRDALLLYHAGMIERALGNDRVACSYLARALVVNPWFHPTHPAEARATLDSLPCEGVAR